MRIGWVQQMLTDWGGDACELKVLDASLRNVPLNPAR